MPPFTTDKNYFELFGLPADFDVDTNDLAERYRELARQVHPDRFASGSNQERRLAMQATALLNEAFQTLKDPVLRAPYLLRVRGVDLGAESDTVKNPAFLAEQMEFRERLEEAREHAQAKAKLAELSNEVRRRLQQTMKEVRARLAKGTQLSEARDIVREMQFLEKVRRQIDDLEEGLA